MVRVLLLPDLGHVLGPGRVAVRHEAARGAHDVGQQLRHLAHVLLLVPQIDPSVPQPVFTIKEKALTRAFSWLKAATTAFTFKTVIRHYAEQALTPR